jgi:muramoyltetrapeptide carboxypeptidase LdcA involved in peptidoglycan recycling
MIRYPEYIKRNSDNVIGITAMSDFANPDKIDYAIENIKKLGYSVVETNNVRTSFKLTSSSGKTRVEELLKLYKDDNVKYIIAARGGEFAMEMLEYLDENRDIFEKFSSFSPKWIQGYSDISLILYYLLTNYNIASIHSSNVNTYAMDLLYKSLLNTFKVVEGDFDKEFIQKSYEKYQISELGNDPKQEFNLTENVKYMDLNGEKNQEFSGRLIGGCIDVISILLGTKYDNTVNFCSNFKEGMIWYIDNFALDPTELYRKLWQIKEAGWFGNANGFLIGRTYAKKEVGDFTYEDALKRTIGLLNVPVIYDVDLGHTEPQFTLINGSLAKFIYKDGKGQLIQILQK